LNQKLAFIEAKLEPIPNSANSAISGESTCKDKGTILIVFEPTNK